MAVDTETNVTETLADRFPVGISVATEKEDFYIPLGHSGTFFSENYRDELPKDLFQTDSNPIIVMHNAKFDLQVLKDFDVPTGMLVDTMLMHHYIDEYPPHGLKELAKELLGWEEPAAYRAAIRRMEKTAGGYENIPVPAMAQYAMQDTRMTYCLFEKLYPEWLPEHRELWKNTDRPFMLLLTKMEERGILIDRELALQRSFSAGKRLQEIVYELGFDPAKPDTLREKLYGLPPMGLGLKPTYTKTGKLATDDKVLAGITHPLGGILQEYRGLVKMKSSYYNAYLTLSEQDARLHANFLQHGTLTGRLACKDPNLQQIPRDVDLKPIKKLFLPDPGKELWEFDFRNLEARLAAVYAQDETMLEVFRNEGDIHQTVADRLGIDRFQAKVAVFSTLYGGGATNLSFQLGISFAKANQFIEAFKTEFPKLFESMALAEATADENGWVRLWTDRRRHFKYPSEHRKAFNSVIQGGGFEIVKKAMLILDEAGYEQINQVHDSTWVQLEHKDVKDALVEIPRLMSEWTLPHFGLNFSVDGKRLN